MLQLFTSSGYNYSYVLQLYTSSGYNLSYVLLLFTSCGYYFFVTCYNYLPLLLTTVWLLFELLLRDMLSERLCCLATKKFLYY